ncbi:MAG: hypothetical protein A4E71_00553 [Smithella sp. PtaU1.Bin162]|nr:MAG: hypothetical protein A4E71_00553 [Smithella sp. PtaU1.Bin162]
MSNVARAVEAAGKNCQLFILFKQNTIEIRPRFRGGAVSHLKKENTMHLEDRDKQIFSYLAKFHCLTAEHVALLFGMNIKNCQRRLRKLTARNYIQFIQSPGISAGKSPYLFYLGESGCELMNIEFKKPRLTVKLSHQQKNTDILVKIISDFRDSDILCEVIPEHILREEQPSIIPDAAFMLQRKSNEATKKQALFLVENCEGTEIISSKSFNQDIEKKFISYVSYFNDGDTLLYDRLFGCSFKRFRVLYIASSLQRQNSISKIISSLDSDGFIWITTIELLEQKGIKAEIWQVPGTGEKERRLL